MKIEGYYQKALDKKSKILSEKKADYQRRLDVIKSTNSEFNEIIERLSVIGPQICIAGIANDTEKLSRLKAESMKLNTMVQKIIENSKIEPIQYDCTTCNDTGYVDGKICNCIKNMAIEYNLEEFSKNCPVMECRFENFYLDYYSNVVTNGTSPLKRMTAIFKFSKEYVINFSKNNGQNVLFCGNTGVGKTHISMAICYELIKRGFDVAYDTSFNLFAKIENEHFKIRTNDYYEELISSDLLVIDDLGSEYVTPYIQSVLYNIINSRILSKKSTIINTNLSMKEIEDKYTPRVSSRLVGEYISKKFLGDDIRQKKAFEK